MRGLVVTTSCCLALAAASSEHQPSTTTAASSACAVTGPMLDVMHERYHSDNVCDRAEYNRFKAAFDRVAKAESLGAGSRHELVPNERTVHCPAHVQSLYPASSPGENEWVTGFDRSWIVENTASTPVVVLWVDPHDGIEKSAFSDAMPPTTDPEAVLAPGQWTVVSGYEGHVFHVREVMPDGTMGRVLLQHRLGWIAVGAKLTDRARQLVCPDNDDPPVLSMDTDHHENDNNDSDSTESTTTDGGDGVYHPDFVRTPPRDDRHCNRQDVGFRNVLGCPVHGFYVEEDTCDEVFKMHLGVGGSTDGSFMDDWTSRTKFEATYSGHTFVFRSAHTGAEVDRITIRPTAITDCPDDAAQTAIVQRSAAEAEGLAVVRLEGVSVQWNSTAASTSASLWSSMATVQLPYSAIKTQGAQR
jgi:hypothetical protein